MFATLRAATTASERKELCVWIHFQTYAQAWDRPPIAWISKFSAQESYPWLGFTTEVLIARALARRNQFWFPEERGKESVLLIVGVSDTGWMHAGLSHVLPCPISMSLGCFSTLLILSGYLVQRPFLTWCYYPSIVLFLPDAHFELTPWFCLWRKKIHYPNVFRRLCIQPPSLRYDLACFLSLNTNLTIFKRFSFSFRVL